RLRSPEVRSPEERPSLDGRSPPEPCWPAGAGAPPEAACSLEPPSSPGEAFALVPVASGGVAPGVNPAAGRSGRRTSMYDAPAELGSASTRARESHLAWGLLSSPKYASRFGRSTSVSPSGPLNARTRSLASAAGAALITARATSSDGERT